MNILPQFIRRRIKHRENLLKIADNIGWLCVDSFIRMMVGLLVGVWLARHLGPDSFGVLSFASALVGVFGSFIGLGMQGIVVRDIVGNLTSKEITLGTVAVLKFVAGLMSYSLLIILAYVFRSDDFVSKLVILIIGLSLLFKISDVAIYWFESQVASKYVVWVQNGVFLIFSLIKGALILNNEGIVAFAWVMMAESLCLAIALVGTMSLHVGKISKLRYEASRAINLLKDSWPLLISSLAVTVYMRVDQIMLGEIAGNFEVGIFAAASRVSEIWYFVPIAVVTSLAPALFSAKHGSSDKYHLKFQVLFCVMVWLSIGLSVLMTFLAMPLMTLIFGGSYVSAGYVLAIHIWSSVFVFMGVVSGQWLLAENLPMLSFQRTTIGALVNIALNLWLIPLHGAIGAALATVGAQFFANFAFDIFQKKTRVIFYMKLRAFDPRILLKVKELIQ